MPDQKSGEENKSQKKLNPKQERFVLEYIKCNEGRKACELAGYKTSNASNTASSLLRNPLVLTEIQRQKALLKHELLKDRQTFLCEVTELKALCLEQKRIGDLVKLLNLEAEVLNLKKPDQQTGNVNIFQHIQGAKDFLSTLPEHKDAFKGTNVTDAVVDMPRTENVEPSGYTAQETGNPVRAEDSASTTVIDI